MSEWQTKWTKAQRDRCDFRDDKSLFIVGVEREAGRFENSGIMDAAKAALLFRFASELYAGLPARAAFDAAVAALSAEGQGRVHATTARVPNPGERSPA